MSTQHYPRHHAHQRREYAANRPLSIRRHRRTNITSPRQRSSRQKPRLRRGIPPLPVNSGSSHTAIEHDLGLVHEYWECFQSLPPKIQKIIFSKEEQRLLLRTAPASCHFIDAADRALLRLEERRRASRNRRSIRADTSTLASEELIISNNIRRQRRSRSRSITSTTISNIPSLSLEEPSTPDTDPTEPSDPTDSGIEMEESILDSFRWLDEEEDLDLSLDSYHKYVSDTALPSQHVRETPTSPRRMPSFRRTLSFARNRNSMMLIGSSGRALNSSQSSTVPFSSSGAGGGGTNQYQPRHAAHRSTSSIDPAAQYYQDPEARLKLRVYLASPQKFDEAIEFGFPSLEDKENVINNGNTKGNTRRQTANRDSKRISQLSTSTHGWTFLDDETTSIDLSLFDDFTRERPPSKRYSLQKPSRRDDKDVVSSDVREVASSPPRPYTSLPSTRRPQTLKPTSSSGNANARVGGHRREMTLKMTLTRPDLRTVNGSDLQSSLYDQDDPLRLAALPPADESVNIWDDMPEERGVVKKMWRKLRSWRD